LNVTFCFFYYHLLTPARTASMSDYKRNKGYTQLYSSVNRS